MSRPTKSVYWPDDYVGKRRTAAAAIDLLRPGQRVFIGTACGEPQHLTKALFLAARRFTDLEIVRLHTLESLPLSLLADRSADQLLNIRSFYLGSTHSIALARNRRFVTPVNLCRIPRLFRTRLLPLHAALVQVSPPDDFGWMSLGISVDITLAAVQAADLVIAQVNPRMPRTHGRSFVHVNEVDVVVEHEEELMTPTEQPDAAAAGDIARIVARLVDDGATLQVGLGPVMRTILAGLAGKKDLGIHTQFLTDDIMHLVSQGVITNRCKGHNEGKLVASGAVGSEALYLFLDNNPCVEMHPSDVVSHPGIVALHRRMVSINEASIIDLTGQAAVDASAFSRFAGVTGLADFVRGAGLADDGLSILVLPARDTESQQSRIVARLQDREVVIPRGDAHYVVTEYGAVNLYGKSLQERAMALISIAHPDFREALLAEAKQWSLVAADRSLADAARGVYPFDMEEDIAIEGQKITIRPARPVDERRIQEHFYTLDRDDVDLRFFHPKASFVRRDVAGMYQIDYHKDLTLVAVTGEFGFDRVIALGGYVSEPAGGMAEVAFSVDRAWQGRGLGKRLLCKLAEAARQNGIAGLVAYLRPHNRYMIRLFGNLPYPVAKTLDADMLVLKCRFSGD